MIDDSNIYTYLTPKRVADIGVCFFCGSEADGQVFCPPEKFSAELSGPAYDYVRVVACHECSEALKNQRVGTLSQQRELARQHIQKKYGLALRLFQLWDLAEAEELKRESSSFYGSVNAALSLGEEANNRLRYQGFDVEEGVYAQAEEEVGHYRVFDQSFSSYKEALHFASRSYGVDIAFLANYATPRNPDFDKGIKRWQSMIEEQLQYDLEVKEVVRRFVRQYKLDKKLVERSVRQLVDEGVLLEYDEIHKKLIERLHVSIGSANRR